MQQILFQIIMILFNHQGIEGKFLMMERLEEIKAELSLERWIEIFTELASMAPENYKTLFEIQSIDDYQSVEELQADAEVILEKMILEHASVSTGLSVQDFKKMSKQDVFDHPQNLWGILEKARLIAQKY